MKDWPKILRDVPDAELTSEYKRRISAKRKTFGAGYNGGRPKSADRCACGKFTSATAAKRSHKCAKPQQNGNTERKKSLDNEA